MDFVNKVKSSNSVDGSYQVDLEFDRYCINLENDLFSLAFEEQSLDGRFVSYMIYFEDSYLPLHSDYIMDKIVDLCERLITHENLKSEMVKAYMTVHAEYILHETLIKKKFTSYGYESVEYEDEDFFIRHYQRMISKLRNYEKYELNDCCSLQRYKKVVIHLFFT